MAQTSPVSETLKPCPFCGEPANDWHGSFGEYVSCTGCGARSGNSPSQKEARDWWNVRTSDLAQAAPVPALVEFFKWAMREGPWEGGDLDGGSIQDKAESLGLIVKTKFDPDKHGGADFSEGDDYYEFAPGVSITSTPRESESDLREENLRSLLREARQYVSDDFINDDMEVHKHSASLLKDIDAALSISSPVQTREGE
jgi:hypothetical protein